MVPVQQVVRNHDMFDKFSSAFFSVLSVNSGVGVFGFAAIFNFS